MTNCFVLGWRREITSGRGKIGAAFLVGLLAIAALARAEESPRQKTDQEESLLVATREMPPADPPAEAEIAQPSGEDSLEPVSQTPDRTPELASGEAKEDAEALEFRAGLEGEKPKQKAQQAARPAPIRRAPPTETAVATPYEPVKFRGILVGKTPQRELVEKWGESKSTTRTQEGNVMAYDVPPFQAVDVLLDSSNIVSAIKISLAAPLEVKFLAKQLSLDSFLPAVAKNDQGQPLGQVFPERGVLFTFESSDSDALASDGDTPANVTHVVIHPIDAHSFALRAENHGRGEYLLKITDLKAALALDPEYGHAQWLLANVYLETGQIDQAEAAAAKACELEPENAAYQLCHGRTQEALGEYDASVLTVRAVLDRGDLADVDRAQALFQMAKLASLGDAEIAAKSITFHERAIELADKLAESTKIEERRAAKRILVESHLAVAEEVARQPYSSKVENLSLWVGRASGLAEDFIESDGGSVELRLLVAQRALAALASFRPTLDPAPWVAEAQEAADALLSQSEDDLWRARVKWELGVAYFHALRVDHLRRETATALRYGEMAVEHFAAGALQRQAVHASEQMVGQLYFQIGAVHAVHQLDHSKAAPWYDKAEPLLTSNRPVSELYAPRREGEMLVSMGVSFWQLGDQKRALELTQSGVNLVEIAVDDGILAKSALSVPYGNLATMYRQLGEDKNATKYAELSRDVAAATPATGKQPPRVGNRPQRTEIRQPRTASRTTPHIQRTSGLSQ